MDIIIGPFSDAESVGTGMFGGIYEIPQISYGATSSELDNKELYPFLARTIVTDYTKAQALCAFWKSSNYRFGAILYSDDHYGRSFQKAITTVCGANVTFSKHAFKTAITEKEIDQKVSDVAEKKMNIVLAIFKDFRAFPAILAAAFKHNILGAGTQWILTEESILQDIYPIESFSEIRKALNGSFVVSSVGGTSYNDNFRSFVSAWDTFDFGDAEGAVRSVSSELDITKSFFQAFDADSRAISEMGAYEYDAVMTAGLQVCSLYPEDPIPPSKIFAEQFISKLEDLSFDGLTGNLQFESTGNRREETGSFQLFNILSPSSDPTQKPTTSPSNPPTQEPTLEIPTVHPTMNPTLEGGAEQTSPTSPPSPIRPIPVRDGFAIGLIATFSSLTRDFEYDCAECTKPLYTGGVEEMPLAINPPEEDLNSSKAIKNICVALFALTALVAVFFLLWTFFYRRHPVIRSSQANFLNMISLGAIISSTTILPLTVDDADGPLAGLDGENTKANIACNAALWLYCLGFMTTLTPLFAKMYRIRLIYTSTDKSEKFIKKISDMWLLGLIMKFIVLDLVFLVIWMVQGPFKYIRVPVAHDKYGFVTASSGRCVSEFSGVGIVLIGGYHLVILLFGSVMSYKYRNFNAAMCEAKYVSIALISNLQVLILAVPILNVVSNDPGTEMFVRCGVIALNDISVQLVVFLPKLYYHYKGVPIEVTSFSNTPSGMSSMPSQSVTPSQQAASSLQASEDPGSAAPSLPNQI
uniref:G-protein coupled receptors family 3 profile domain-containing protein n=2 Tax=Mucochytrium quahogii TaxID=96639 RepID=A0A7S2SNP3_9STRA|mmetsp:Transcript_848/g.1645  ORF Transcript_848/g.1645 Transcript_848/m.1645 type:complete len:753 (+) Transcript_848:1548-3806(+)